MQVIDDQKKTEELEREKIGKEGTPRPLQGNARYPEGVKKFTIDRGGPTTEDRKYFGGSYGELLLYLKFSQSSGFF